MSTVPPIQTGPKWLVPAGTTFAALLTVLGAYFEAYPQHHYAGLHLASHLPVIALLLPLMGALGLTLVQRSATGALAIAALACMAWSLLGQLNGATLVPVLVALFWLSRETPWRQALALALPSAILLWVVNGLFGPFGWIGGPGLTMWPEMATALALGGIVYARRQWRAETAARLHDAAIARQEEVQHIIDQERMRIARELHDVVAHSMAMINIQANAALTVIQDNPKAARESVEEIRQASKSGLRELRAILAVMRDPEHGTPTEVVPDLSAIRTLVDAVTAAGTPTSLVVDEEYLEPPAPIALATFRIIQEALTNVVRHARAAETTVTIRRVGSCIRLTIANGPAAQRSIFNEGTGAGIIGMSERARSLSGTFTSGVLENGGFEVTAELPLPTSSGTSLPLGNEKAESGELTTSFDQMAHPS